MSKQIFNCIVFTGDQAAGAKGFITYHKINSTDKFKKFLDRKFPEWVFFTVYDHGTRQKLSIEKRMQ